jgi:hypothetical protein
MQPNIVLDSDAVPAADVGWKLYAELATDVADEFYGVGVEAIAFIVPETWKDEETIDTYPFFIQQLEGGVPVPPPIGILKGSLASPRRLRGTIGRRVQLTGSLKSRTQRVLTGSMNNRRRR